MTTRRITVPAEQLDSVNFRGMEKGTPVTVTGEAGAFTFVVARQEKNGIAVTVHGGRKGRERTRTFTADRVDWRDPHYHDGLNNPSGAAFCARCEAEAKERQ